MPRLLWIQETALSLNVIAPILLPIAAEFGGAQLDHSLGPVHGLAHPGAFLSIQVKGRLLLSTTPGLATFVLMNTISIDLSPETYKRLEEQAQKTGQAVEVLSRELLETALSSHAVARPQTAREVLQMAGRMRPLSDTLRRKIIPGVTLNEVRAILSQAEGLPLSDLIQEQRGTKS